MDYELKVCLIHRSSQDYHQYDKRVLGDYEDMLKNLRLEDSEDIVQRGRTCEPRAATGSFSLIEFPLIETTSDETTRDAETLRKKIAESINMNKDDYKRIVLVKNTASGTWSFGRSDCEYVQGNLFNIGDFKTDNKVQYYVIPPTTTDSDTIPAQTSAPSATPLNPSRTTFQHTISIPNVINHYTLAVLSTAMKAIVDTVVLDKNTDKRSFWKAFRNMKGYMLLYSLYDNRLQSEDDQRQPDSSNTIQKTIAAINDSGRNLTTNPVPLDVNTLAVLLQNLFHQEGTAMFASNTMLSFCLHFPAYACYHYLYQSRTEAIPLKTGETSLSDSSPTDEETDEDRVHDIQHKTFQWLGTNWKSPKPIQHSKRS